MYEEMITKQELIDAQVDAKDLEKIINDAPEIQVQTRLGRYAWTLSTIEQRSFAKINEWQNAINTIVVNDGVPALAVSNANGKTQQEINDFGGAEWWNKPGGYKLGATVKLENGDIVKSTVANNINDPNADMTGWVNTNDASQVTYGFQNQSQINSQTVTPYQFGAIGSNIIAPVSDWYTVGSLRYRKYANLAAVQADYPHVTSGDDYIDWASLQAFFNYCGTVYVVNANCSIESTINKPLNSKFENTPTKLMTGDLKLTTDAPMDYALWLHGQRFQHMGTIRIFGPSGSPANRTLKTGLILGQDGNMSNAHINYVEVVNTAGSGVIVGQNCHFTSFGAVRGQLNGSGLVGNASLSLSSTFSGKVNTIGDINQRSTISVGTIFPERHTLDTQTFVNVSGQLYRVESFDRVAKTISIYPCLPNDVDSGSLSYIYGASLFIFGNNTANTSVNELQSIQSGIGFSTVALYGTQIMSLSTEFLGIAASISFRGGATIGSACVSAYFEGNTTDIVYGWDANSCSFPILQTTALSPTKITNLYSFRNLGTGVMTGSAYEYAGYGDVAISGKKYNSADYTGGLAVTDRIPVKHVFANTANYAMTLNEDLVRLFGKSAIIYTLHGSGANGNPTGTITFTGVNGGSLVINGADYNRPIQVSIVRTAANVLNAKVINSTFLSKGTTAQRPAIATDGSIYLDTTLIPTNGKPIFKSGSIWVDATGTVV